MNFLQDRKVQNLIDLPPGYTPVKWRWVYVIKSNYYNSLPWQRSFPYIFFSCYVSLPGILLLCLPSLPSHPGTPYIHCMCPLTPMPFLVLLLDREYPFSSFLVMDAYFYSQFSHTNYVFLLLIHPSITFHDFLPFTQQNILPCSAMFFHLLSRPTSEYISPSTCTHSSLLIYAIYVLLFPCLVSPKSPRPNLPLSLVASELTKLLITFISPELVKLLITSTSLHSTFEGLLLIYLNH